MAPGNASRMKVISIVGLLVLGMGFGWVLAAQYYATEPPSAICAKSRCCTPPSLKS